MSNCWRRLAPWLLAAAVVCLAAPALAGGEASGPTVSVSGQASFSLAPERVSLVAGVVTEAPGAQEAAAENAKAMARVRDALAEAVGEGGRLTTAGYSVAPRYEWIKDRSERRLVGFTAVNRLRVESPRVEQVGALLDAAVGAGANTVQGPDWSLADPSAAMIKAQAQALANARAQAQALAREAGLALGRVLSIKASGERSSPRPMRLMQAKNAGSQTPVEPGTLEVSAQVRCVFALVAE
jgi:hypothetical protein